MFDVKRSRWSDRHDEERRLWCLCQSDGVTWKELGPKRAAKNGQSGSGDSGNRD